MKKSEFKQLIREEVDKAMNENAFTRIDLIQASYTEPSQRHRFYGMYVKLDNGKKHKFSGISEANQFLKDLFNIKTELPSHYDEMVLTKIQKEIKNASTMKVPFEFDDVVDIS